MQLLKYISILLALIIPAAVSAENKPVNIGPGVADIIVDADGGLCRKVFRLFPYSMNSAIWLSKKLQAGCHFDKITLKGTNTLKA